MKKKLTLARETLRSLSDSALRRAAGGTWYGSKAGCGTSTCPGGGGTFTTCVGGNTDPIDCPGSHQCYTWPPSQATCTCTCNCDPGTGTCGCNTAGCESNY